MKDAALACYGCNNKAVQTRWLEKQILSYHLSFNLFILVVYSISCLAVVEARHLVSRVGSFCRLWEKDLSVPDFSSWLVNGCLLPTSSLCPCLCPNFLFLAALWLRLHLPMQSVWVWSLVWKLRSYILHGQKKKKNKKNTKNKKTNHRTGAILSLL